jgi:hypothetical protein
MEEYNDATYWFRKQQQAMKDLKGPVDEVMKQQRAIRDSMVDPLADAKAMRDLMVDPIADAVKRQQAAKG